MSVMTPARNQTEVSLFDLPQDSRDEFLQLMDQADDAVTVNEIRLAHAAAAATIGIPLPPSGEIALCSCDCSCQTVYDAADRDAHVYHDGYGEIAQCPACADDHRGNGED